MCVCLYVHRVTPLPDKEVLLVWKELEESRNTLADLQAIQLEKGVSSSLQECPLPSRYKDNYVSSVEWLSVISYSDVCTERLYMYMCVL